MKPSSMNWCLLLIVLSTAVSGNAQTTWIANANPGAVSGSHVFTGTSSINDAIAAASEGDIIYVIPSGIEYQSPTVDKSVSIIGSGFNPSNTSAQVSKTFQFNIRTSNVRISGFVCQTVLSNLASGSVSNIVVDHCRLNGIELGAAGVMFSNIVVHNCILGEGTLFRALNLLSSVTNIKITNSIIYTGCGSCDLNINGALFENNIFLGVSLTGADDLFLNVTDCEFRSNIFYGVRPTGSANFQNNTFRNNLSFNTTNSSFSTSNGNQSIDNIEDLDPMFENMILGTTHSFNSSAKLLAGSQAIGTGFGGVDMGIFGGPAPFDVTGSPLPQIQSVTMPSIVTQGTDMVVRIQASGN